MLPIRIGVAAQALAQGNRKLLNAHQPLLGQIVPDFAQRRILQGVGGRSTTPLRELSRKAAIHQLEKPGLINLQGPKAIEQLLALIQLGWRQAELRCKRRSRAVALAVAAQQQPTQR